MISFGFLAATIFTALAILAVWHYLPCMRELRVAQKRGLIGPGKFVPPVRVILCLRGVDPFLDRCLRGLVNQHYPDYKVLIVVDSPKDEALPQAQKLSEEYGDQRVEVLIRDRILPNCSRRASSLFCGLDHVPADVEVVVMCDADAIPHPTWLRELVAPLADPMTVAAFGNRWYSPIVLTLAGMCRYYWNAMAFRAMYKYRIPWSGSLAMRKDLFRDPAFLNCLQHAFSEDTALAGFLANKPQQAMPVVTLVMLNEETIGIKSFWTFLIRQMLAARLHHPHWPSVLTEAIVILVVIWLLLPLSILQGPVSFGWWCAGAGIYEFTVLVAVGYFEWLVRRYLWQQRRQLAAPWDWKRICLAPIGLFLTAFIYPMAVAITLFTRKHEWRGIVYRIESKGVTVLHEREGFASQPVGRYESV